MESNPATNAGVEKNGKAGIVPAVRNAAMILGLVSGVFALIVAALLVMNHRAMNQSPPADIPELAQMKQQLSANPSDLALRDRIRSLDLLSRRAFFTGVMSMKAGVWLLVCSVALFVVCLKIAGEMSRRLPDPRQYNANLDPAESARRARFALSVMGVLLVAGGVAAGIGMRRPAIPPAQAPAPVTPPSAGVAIPGASADTTAEMLKNWPSFRGPGGLGVATHTNAPVAWNGAGGKNIRWKVPVPRPGYNSPIVWGTRILLTGADKDSREIYCIDTVSGQVLWTHACTGVPGSPATLPEVTQDTGYAAATMTTDGKTRFFAIFTTGDILCVDHCGTRLWARNLGVPGIRYGYASSLITYGGILIVQYDTDIGGRIMGLNCADGKTVWDVSRKVDQGWTSPVLVNSGKRVEIVTVANPFVSSYDPATGKELWSIECMGGEVAPSAAYAGGMVFAANESVRLAAIKIGDQAKQVWESFDGLPNVASPVATPKYVFMASSGGTLTCHDALEGKLLWKEEVDEGFYSSPVIVGDRVCVIDMSGVAFVFRAADKYELIAKNELGEKAFATPVFMDGRIYIRGSKNLFCIGEK